MEHAGVNTNFSELFLTLGGLLLAGLTAEYIGKTTTIPRVSLLILTGFILGPAVLNVLPDEALLWINLISSIALLFVGFLLGGKLSVKEILGDGWVVPATSLSVVLVSLLVVTCGTLLMGTSISVALILGAIATATDPIATLDSIAETKSKGQFTDTLQRIVAVDDAWGLLAFSLVMVVVGQINGTENYLGVLVAGLWEMIGAIALGVLLGIPMAIVSGRLKPGRPTMLEALGMVLLCGGLAHYLAVSFILSSMVMGAVVRNYGSHHERAFHQIEDIEWPFVVLFFTLTGASLSLLDFELVWPLATGYVVFRICGRYLGCWPGATLSGAIPSIGFWMGGALLPQAGVATGMALIAVGQLPELASTLLPVVVISTLFFELVGPFFTRLSLHKAGDLPSKGNSRE